MPVDQLNKPGCHPINTSQVQNYRDLLMQVNIGSNDRRTSMSNYPEVFPPAMQANLERTSGQVFCTIGKDTYASEARIIEDSRQIITNAHVFGEKGQPLPDKLPNCTFATKANPNRKIPLDLREGFYHLGTHDPHRNRANDFALVRLKDSVGDVEIPKMGSAPVPGEKVYLVTHEAEGAVLPVDPNQLVAQDCTAFTSRSGSASGLGFFTTDCSSLEGDSAGTFYVVREGETLAVGFLELTGFSSNNGKSYDIANPDPTKRSFSLGLTYDEKLLSESRALAKRASDVANRNSDRKVNSVPPKG
jgi:hypothetical protein